MALHNTYIAVDALWSYSFVGSLKDYVELDLRRLDEVYRLVSEYIVHRHTFYITCDGQPYNLTMASLNNRADALGIPAGMFQFYCDSLFRSMIPSFNQMSQSIQQVTPINNEKGDIIAFVASSQLH